MSHSCFIHSLHLTVECGVTKPHQSYSAQPRQCPISLGLRQVNLSGRHSSSLVDEDGLAIASHASNSSLKTSCANHWLTQKCITWFIAHNYVWPGMPLGKRGTVSPFSFACLLLTDQFWQIGWRPWVKDVVNLLGRASSHDLADVPALSVIIQGEFFNCHPPKSASR